MTSLDLGDKFDTSKVTNMKYMFNECGYQSMTSLKLGDKFNTTSATNIYHTFYQCGQEKLENFEYGGTLANFTTNCANLLPAESGAYLQNSNFKSCSTIKCSDGEYTLQ